MNGWLAESRDEPDIRVIHLRQMGSSQQSLWVGRVRWGRGKYFMGSAWYYVLAVSVYRLFERPLFLSGIGIAWGYTKAMLEGHSRYENPAYRKFFRRYELQSLLSGKRRTMDRHRDRIYAEFSRR